MLQVQNLVTEYSTESGELRAVDDVDIFIDEGEMVGIVGESGCGKTTLAKSILRLLDENGEIVNGGINYKGEDISALSDADLRERIRWQEISYIPQSAMAALDPVYNVGDQIIEVVQEHTDLSKNEALDRARDLFVDVGLDPDRVHDYPHELSGGQRQRVVIALALVLSPSLVIADEPTTGLDVIVQNEILERLLDLQEEIGCSMVFVTHDMSVVAEVTDRVAVMYGGQIAEIGPTTDVFTQSLHPYTIGLKNAFPEIKPDPEMTDLIRIPGSPPNLQNTIEGCRFKARCPFATEECDTLPQLQDGKSAHKARCHYIDRADELREKGSSAATWGE